MVFLMILFGHENNRCPFAACPRPGSVAATRRRGGSQGDDGDGGGPVLRRDPPDRGQVGGRLGGGWQPCVAGKTTRSSAGPPAGAGAGCTDRPADRGPLSRPVAASLRPLDAGGRGR